MNSIEIDFDVFKEITNRRVSESVTPNDVLRKIFGLESKQNTNVTVPISGNPWVIKGVTFHHGTEFKATYKGREHHGIVDNGALDVKGKRFASPSAAAVSITRNSVNGWNFWECKMPGNQSWQLIESYRNYELHP